MSPGSREAVLRLFEDSNSEEQENRLRRSLPSATGEDHTEIERALRSLLEPGTVAELRVPGTKQGVVSGYFDDFGKLAEAAVNWSGKAPAVYVTLNPVQAELLARCKNRVKHHAKQTTQDPDIVHRRRLLIDFDPVRTSGISSTEQEHKQALSRAEQCRAWLTSQGWPEPVLADSGNGAHLIYGIDLPNDDDSRRLIQHCLEALSVRFTGDGVDVDQTTFSASRLCKIYGTLACKGDSTHERPHRMAAILDAPNNLSIVTRGQLQDLSSKRPQPIEGEHNGRRSFDVEDWIRKHDLKVARTGPWQQGRKWVLNPCPFDPSHTDDSAYILQFPTGAVAAGCHHNGCAGKDWHSLRDELEPEWREKLEAAKQNKASQSSQLLSIVSSPAFGMELFHTPDHEPFASFNVEGHRETWPIGSKNFTRWLSRAFYERQGKPPNKTALDDTIRTLEGDALFKGKSREVFTRVAEHGDALYLDLADPAWRVVRITPKGWTVAEGEPPVRFVRTKAMLPLPLPSKGGSVEELRPLINAADQNNWVLIVAWLLAALRFYDSYPILAVYGEQGSAKSTLVRLLRMLIDPAIGPIRSAPSSQEDLMIQAKNGWVAAFDNLSGIKNDLSDAFCRLSTGSGLSTRRLYSNDEEFVFDASRPIVLNGIEEIITRPDLADRSLMVHLPPISDSQRQTGAKIKEGFQQAAPKILGALLTAVSMALRNLESTKLEKAPRMADFAHWIVSAEPALPWEPGEFLRVYDQNRAEAVETALEDDQIATAIRKMMRVAGEEWRGTATKLLEALTSLVDDRTKTSRWWPSTPSALSRKLKRPATFLRRAGIDIEFARRGKKREIVIRQTGANAVEAVTAVESKAGCTPQLDGNDGDDGSSTNGQAVVSRILRGIEERSKRRSKP